MLNLHGLLDETSCDLGEVSCETSCETSPVYVKFHMKFHMIAHETSPNVHVNFTCQTMMLIVFITIVMYLFSICSMMSPRVN